MAEPRQPRALEQVDVIVLDVSCSMKSKSSVDPDMTREDLSKLVFHTMVDKMLCLEMEHAVGLIAFGASMETFPFTEEYETFHTALGRLDAGQSATMLYDAILAAAAQLKDYQQQHPLRVAPECPLRVFVLTDGEDNRSMSKPWEVARRLQEMNVTLDAFPMGQYNATLHALCRATGGMCVDVSSVEQGTALFEREAVIHVAARATDPSTEIAGLVRTPEDFTLIEAALRRSGAGAEHSAGASRQQQQSSGQRATTQATVAAAASSSAGSVRRLLKELSQMQGSAHAAHVCGDVSNWKVVLAGPAGTPYEGGHFVMSLRFPSDFPFRPPAARFLTPVFHCNVNADGAVCIDILRDAWSPALTVQQVCDAMVRLLASPDAQNPLDSVKATLLREEPERYREEAARMTAQEAMPLDAVLSRYNLVEDGDGTTAGAPTATSAGPGAAAGSGDAQQPQ